MCINLGLWPLARRRTRERGTSPKHSGGAISADRGERVPEQDTNGTGSEVNMEIKTFTYEKKLGKFQLMGWLSQRSMDDHMAEMLTAGWKVVSQNTIPGNGRTFGPGVIPDKMVVTYQKG
jgi:hypothetical protein